MKSCLRCIIFFTILCFFCIHCTNKEFNYSKFIVGSTCEVKFYTENDSIANAILSEVDAELIRLDSLLNRFSEASLVSELNRALRIKAPEDIIQLFLLSDSVSRITDGLFDISIAPLLELWGFYEHEFKNPDTAKITLVKKLVDCRKIKIENDSIIIPEGMKIDLGAIAQGYAADRVAMILKERNIISALINIGGEIVGIGQSPKKRPWRIGIRNPRAEGVIERVELENAALSTSGDYEKYFIIEDQRYPHIINPKTGFPALNFVSVTIFADNAAYADAMATAVAIMGSAEGVKFLDSLGIRGIIYYEENGQLQRVESNKRKDIE